MLSPSERFVWPVSRYQNWKFQVEPAVMTLAGGAVRLWGVVLVSGRFLGVLEVAWPTSANGLGAIMRSLWLWLVTTLTEQETENKKQQL